MTHAASKPKARAFPILVATNALMTIGGCSFGSSPDDFTQPEVGNIARKCGVAPRSIKLNQGWVFILEPDGRDPRKSCVFKELKRTGKSHLSAVGNELYQSGS